MSLSSLESASQCDIVNMVCVGMMVKRSHMLDWRI